MIFSRRKRHELRRAQAEAQAALTQSVDHLHGTVLRAQEARHVADRLRELQRQNHFAESIRSAYGRPT
ncbi:DUF7620 family protein [Oerskovia paurometabola]|uniref:DUF7620 family protein n=1 Tax=Oerskovia paurometabola TaxID=162170 RepID=UPI003444B159